MTFSGPELAGEGIALNLSREGSLVESDVVPRECDYLEVTLHLPDEKPPMLIQSAAVRWVSGRVFGLKFLYMNLSEYDRLDRALQVLITGNAAIVPEQTETTRHLAIDRRKEPHIRVRFHTDFASNTAVTGEGTVLDLSTRGCRVASETAVAEKTKLELSLACGQGAEPLRILEAIVRWSRGNEFGLEFQVMDQTVLHRLRQFLTGSTRPA